MEGSPLSNLSIVREPGKGDGFSFVKNVKRHFSFLLGVIREGLASLLGYIWCVPYQSLKFAENSFLWDYFPTG